MRYRHQKFFAACLPIPKSTVTADARFVCDSRPSCLQRGDKWTDQQHNSNDIFDHIYFAAMISTLNGIHRRSSLQWTTGSDDVTRVRGRWACVPGCAGVPYTVHRCGVGSPSVLCRLDSQLQYHPETDHLPTHCMSYVKFSMINHARTDWQQWRIQHFNPLTPTVVI